jgi:hypothetical protein
MFDLVSMKDPATEFMIDSRAREHSSELSRIVCDVLRAMTILGGNAWESDLHDTLREVWGLREEEDKTGSALLTKALELLQENGILKVEKRVRGDLSLTEPIEEYFYRVEEWLRLLQLFGSDREVMLSRRGY